MQDIRPITLEGTWARLEPMRADHYDALMSIAADERIWEWYPWPLNRPDDMRAWVDTAMENLARGEDLPFVIVERETGQIIGSSRYMDIRPVHRGLEIGNTWLVSRWWRTAINSECKYLLLSHAFDTLGAMRVSLKTDALNERSRRAIERLGARFEGIFRKHLVVHGGRIRDSAYYSITDDEWPEIRDRMEAGLYGSLNAGSRSPR